MDSTLKAILFMVVGALVTSVIAAPIGIFVYRLNKRRDRKTEKVLKAEEDAIKEVEVQKRLVSDLMLKMAVLEAEAKPINAAYLAMLVAKATHFHTPEMDALLAKLGPPSLLTPAERVRLEEMIQERMRDMGPLIDEPERLGVPLLLPVSALADLEYQQLSANEMETVLVSQPAKETKPSSEGGTQEEEKGN